MSRRDLSQSPGAIRARERRDGAAIRRAETKWNAEVRAFMDKGMKFDEAWIAAGGIILPDRVPGKAA